jgi:hypothetical protein
MRRWPWVAVAAVLVTAPAAAAQGAARPKAPTITVLSNRADLISGGDAYVRVTLPAGVAPSRVRVTAAGHDVTAQLVARDGGRRLEGVVVGLPLGRSSLIARIRGGRGAKLVITNHPLGGPVFAGPQIQPWGCQKGARDAQCDQAPSFAYVYLPKGAPTAGAGVPGAGGISPFQPYDPKSPPPAGAIATARTAGGVTVPVVVRGEAGDRARDQYTVATLFDPKRPWTATAPQPQFNHRLVITHGFSCDTEYSTGTAPSVLIPKVLGGGFIVMSHALDHAGHNCNLLTQAESLVMTKEYVIDHYGTMRWTIGSGCSGGSLAQQQVANAYPGVYQGITPQCSFTDAWSSAMEYEEYYFGLKYFEDPSRWDPGTLWDPVAIGAVLDHPNIANPITFTTVIPNSGNPSRDCPGVPKQKVYDARSNPHGVRCTLQDYMVNLFGRRPDGFANRAFDNVGIQYGLHGLRTGLVSPAQFVDLNTHIGGADIDLNITPGRTEADPIGLERAYRGGAINEANNLDQVAIIDLRGPDPGAFHDVYRTYAMRARLMRNFGTAANQVLWRGQVPLIGDVGFADEAVFAVDRWLARVDADDRRIALARKIIQDKPGTVGDRCTDGAGASLPPEVCDATVAAYGTPRMGAGEPLTDDVMKCRLKPMRGDDYPVAFSDAQWARLQQAFPTGVCDYSQPGVSQHGAIGWLTYQDADGNVVYGGRPMGPPPRSKALAAKHRHRRT